MELKGSPFGSWDLGPQIGRVEDLRLLTPVEPGKIICVGLNYVAHIKEMGFETPGRPMLFMKPNTCITNPGDPVVYPRYGEQVEYEGEVVAVIGKLARYVSEEEALNYVLGYTCGNDVTERKLQHAELANRSMLISKGFDTFCPLGPFIETEMDPTKIDLTTRLNGELKQRSNTSDLLFPIAMLVSYISQAITLEPGDVIMTGTPSGVSAVSPGDTVDVEISGVGVLRNTFVAENTID